MIKAPPTLPGFIVFEGLDGAGTSTQMARLRTSLEAARIPHWITAEPTDRPEGKLIRSILGGGIEAHPGTLARLFAADRNEHLYGTGGIIEHIQAGQIVVCDRYVASSLAYQGITCGPELPRLLNQDFPLPGLTLFFKIEAETSVARLSSRERLDIFEHRAFLDKVAHAYDEALAWMEERGAAVARIDASQSPLVVERQISTALSHHLGLNFP